MANVSFTRDEVILTLDTIYFSGAKSFSARSPEIIELSQLLNELPIHSAANKPENFRNCTGISHQINHFKNGYSDDEKAWNVGSLFFEVYSEYEHRLPELHAIAESIRRNRIYYAKFPFGNNAEAYQFPEGALLGHLHQILETQQGKTVVKDDRCYICHIDLSDIYVFGANSLQNHLIIPPTKLDGNTKYTSKDFITVCPNCHTALHYHRPWLTKNNCGELLR